jgi:hypothetical protein
MNLLTQNSKLKKTSKLTGKKVFNFSISAYNNKTTGKITCPFAGDCKKYCYAQKGLYKAYAEKSMDFKHQITLTDDFIPLMQKEINKKKPQFIRIHDSGDFYNKTYIDKWLYLVAINPHIKFYAYTKSFILFNGMQLPDNLDLIYSYGGKHDSKINPSIHRHAKIFKSIEDLNKAGYINSSGHDLMSTKWYNKSNKVGLIAH